MKVIFSRKAQRHLIGIRDFIAEDNPVRAVTFIDELEAAMSGLSSMPYRCRPSIYFNDDRHRDLIYKGYIIPYLVDEENGRIVILAVLNRNLP